MKRWLSKYLSILTLVPVVVLFIFIVSDIFRSYHDLEQAEDTIADALLVSTTSDLVHELQKERGMSAGYLGSNGDNFNQELRNQKTLTDAQLKKLQVVLNSHAYTDRTKKDMETLNRRLMELGDIRSKVLSQTIALSNVITFYTKSNEIILELNGHLAAELEETSSAERFLTLYNLAYAKEKSGVERAVLANVLSIGEFTPALFIKFIEISKQQDTYIKSFESVATNQFNHLLKMLIQSKEYQEVESFRQIAKNSEGKIGIEATDWFSAATAKIDKLKSLENTLIEETAAYAKDKVISRRIYIIAEIFILIIMIVNAYAVFSTVRLRGLQAAEIIRVMDKIDKENELTVHADVMSNDELGRIAELLNQTINNIRTDFVEFQDNALQIGSATIQAASAVEQSKSNLIALQSDISSIANATEQMSEGVNYILENMLTASSGAEAAAKETIDGEYAVKTSVQGITDTAEEVATVGNSITDLNTRVQDILGMVDMIKSIAEQTNLLALNAAIEAARAGEQGRGFAVVADEVRSLAQRTQQSTHDISTVVEVLQDSSQKAFSTIESGNQKAQNAVNNAEQVSLVLENIVTNIRTVDEVTKLTSKSTQVQSDLLLDINTNITRINEQARENVVGAEQLSASSIQLSEVANAMEKRIKKYKV